MYVCMYVEAYVLLSYFKADTQYPTVEVPVKGHSK